ncbi:MAG TPA: ribosome biogenesis GTPase Der [Gemmataceae bacterium]|nr:ribosome biogenesis GTPase Der [Gemmataceae bacterium]
MAVPVVAIVGRPNVGKSSLFNWLAGRRIAIVEPTAGVTRDRLSTLIQAGDRFIELVDTGGMGVADADNLTEHVERQIETAIDQAHVLLFVVDGRDGLMPLDEEVARRLRYVTKPILCVANKCDTPLIDPQAAEFYKLGRGKLVCVSTKQNRNREELLDLILERLPAAEELEAPPKDPALKLAIVGRRNTGKSTFINSLAESERVIVSEVPGTTRDSVDVRFERDGLQFVAIDTAGVRRERSMADAIEFYSLARAERSIRRAEVVLMFIDPKVRISKVDKQLAEYILDLHKPAIFVVNKWDLMVPMRTGRMADYIRQTFPSLDYVPIAFITAKSGKNVHATLNLAQNIYKQASRRVPTGELNRVLRQALEASAPPLRQNRRPKIYYASQVAANPPTIVLMTNGPELFDDTYQRYLIKTFRDRLGFSDVPIKLYVRRKNRGDNPTAEERAKARTRKPKVDVSGLPFTTDISEAEKRRGDNPYEASELWTDL